MLEPTISYGAIATICVALIAFGGSLLYNAFLVGRFAASTAESLTGLANRMREIEQSQKQMTDILVQLAQSKVEIQLLSKRIDDVYEHGSHRLSEIISNWQQRNPRS